MAPSVKDVFWYIGRAKNPDQWGRFPKPIEPDFWRGVWARGEWVCDCTDKMTAEMVVDGHNDLLQQSTVSAGETETRT